MSFEINFFRERAKISKALDLARQYAGNDGAHHKDWVIDQMVRCLTGDEYEKWVKETKSGKDGENTYDWEIGIAP